MNISITNVLIDDHYSIYEIELFTLKVEYLGSDDHQWKMLVDSY